MPVETVQAKIQGGETFSVQHDIPGTTQEFLDRFGEEVTYTRTRGSYVIDLQSFMRGHIKKGATQEELQAAVDDWKPGVRAKGATPQEKARAALEKLSAEDREAIIAELGLA